MRFFACGDLHLDKGARYGRVPGERLAEQEQAWARALELARDHDVDVVLFAGDAFEKRHPSPEALLAFERPLVDHAERAGPPVIAIPGNHDRSGVSESCALDVFAEASLLRLLTKPGWVTTPVSVDDDLTIACLPWTPVSRLVAAQNGGDRDDLNQRAAELLVETARGLRAQTDGPCVLLTHFSISGAATPDGADVGLFREPVLDVGDLERIGFDAVIAGHIHRPQLLGSEDSPGPMLYVGSPMPVDFGEGRCEHGVWLLDLDYEPSAETPTPYTFLPIESRRFLTVDVDYSAEPGDFEPVLGFDEDGSFPDVDGAFTKVRLRATAEQARRIDQSRLRNSFVDAGAHNVWVELDVERETRARVEGLDESISDREALTRWIETNVDGDTDRLGDVLDTGNRYLEETAR